MSKTIFDKVWEKHIVDRIPNGPSILYIDKHLIHEVTSPQAFASLNKKNLKVLRPEKTIATADHNVPTIDQHLPIREALSRNQVDTLTKNCKEHNITLFGLGHKYQGIVHVIGPELVLLNQARQLFVVIAIHLLTVLSVQLHLVLEPARLKWF